MDNTSRLNVGWTYSIDWGTQQQMTLGATNYGSGWWTGNMDEIGVWNRCLTSDERTELYGSGSGNPYPF